MLKKVYIYYSGLLKYGRQDLGSYKHDIILAMEWDHGNEHNITLLYNRFALHSLPLGLNFFANHMMQYRDNIEIDFVMTSHPLSGILVSRRDTYEPRIAL